MSSFLPGGISKLYLQLFSQWYQTCGIFYHKLLVIKCKVAGGFAIVNPFIAGVCEEQIEPKTDTELAFIKTNALILQYYFV